MKLGWAHGALATTFPGDTTMARLAHVRAFAKGGSARTAIQISVITARRRRGRSGCFQRFEDLRVERQVGDEYYGGFVMDGLNRLADRRDDNQSIWRRAEE